MVMSQTDSCCVSRHETPVKFAICVVTQRLFYITVDGVQALL